MCGIFFSLHPGEHVSPDSLTEALLKRRGPDSSGTHKTLIPKPAAKNDSSCVKPFHATFFSTVLSLRGRAVIAQPLKDTVTGSVLCWNGEAWKIGAEIIRENDSQSVFQALLHVSTQSSKDSRASVEQTIRVLSTIDGPFAIVYYDAQNHYLYYGRDCLGRRSLLRKSTSDSELTLSSVCDNATGDHWAEVEADGIYVVDLNNISHKTPFTVTRVPHRRVDEDTGGSLSFALSFPRLNKLLQDGAPSPSHDHVGTLRLALERSLQLRIQHVRESLHLKSPTSSPKIAILFSGGLDCTILARMCHDLLPPSESIDLLNVAFENPRIHNKLAPDVSPYEQCPDRITGRASYSELVDVCPDRTWRFVEVNVPYSETMAHRGKVMALMHPHNTEMDLSISYALYFASKGAGLVRAHSSESPTQYVTAAHVLLSGLGADELFGGYQRHAVAYSRRGYPGLIDELELDFNRLGHRNLGRDDRVISDSSKEVRFPYLDEDFISVALGFPVWAKCDFENAQIIGAGEPARSLEPGKRILRLLAWDLDMKSVAAEKKRAIQFGSRTAKMETGKTKGTQILSE